MSLKKTRKLRHVNFNLKLCMVAGKLVSNCRRSLLAGNALLIQMKGVMLFFLNLMFHEFLHFIYNYNLAAVNQNSYRIL